MEVTALTGKTFGQIVGRHIATAAYLFGAELRFKAYCAGLYLTKRPYIARNYGVSAATFGVMYALAILAQIV